MEDRFVEQSEETTNMMVNAGITSCQKLALPKEDLEPHQYKTLMCETCDDDLPEFRMKKGLVLCVRCQSAKETRRTR